MISGKVEFEKNCVFPQVFSPGSVKECISFKKMLKKNNSIMKKSRKQLVLLTALAGIFMFVACNNKEIESENVIIKTTTFDYVNIANSFVLSTEEEITSGDDNGLKSAEVFDCLNVTVHENENGEFWPRSWTLDYGTENCTCYFENSKRGKINITLSDWWRNVGSLREITFEDYYFNDNQLEVTKTIFNTGLNESGNLTFIKNVNDAKLTYTDGSTFDYYLEL
jgi:hypothetical protein